MTEFNIGRWLFVMIAVVGLAFATPAVVAHGDAPTPDDAPPHDGAADGWTTWMDGHHDDGHADGHTDDHADGHLDDHTDGHHTDGHPDDHADDHEQYRGYGC